MTDTTSPDLRAAVCPSCFKTADMEPVEVKRDGKWVTSTVRRCTNPECHSVREGTLLDRVAHINSIYGYKYFGDYELSPEQLDVVAEAVGLANRVPELEAKLAAVAPTITDISTDGPHKITEERHWLARQLRDSKLSDDEAFSIVRYHPNIKPDPEADQARIRVLEDVAARRARCLGFFASVIKSGEPWTETCEAEYRAALDAKGGRR